MKKIILIGSCVLFLTGCTTKTIDLQSELNRAMESSCAEKIFSNTMNKQLYSYYLPENIGRFQSTQSTNVFSDRGRKFIMNLNVPNIIQDAYYKDNETHTSSSLNGAVAQVNGKYNDSQKNAHGYTLSVYDQQGYYVTVFESDVVEFYSVSDAYSAVALSKDMMKIARSLKVNTSEVKKVYSNKKIVDYKSEKMELFEQVVPESGRIEELFEDSNNNTNDASDKNENGPKQITNTEDATE